MDAANMSQNTEQSKAHVKACDSNENKIKLAGTSSAHFFSVQRHVASARSFNSYPRLLQMRLII